MPSRYIPNVSLTIAQAQEQYTRDGICRPWSGDAVKRHEARMLKAHMKAQLAKIKKSSEYGRKAS